MKKLISLITICIVVIFSTLVNAKQNLKNEMEISVHAFVKVDGKNVEGAGRLSSSTNLRISKISPKSSISYDLNGRIPTKEIVLFFEIDKIELDSYKEFGAKLALGEVGEISGFKFQIPHHIEFSNPLQKPEVYRMIIHFKEIRSTLRNQLAPQLVDKTIAEHCEKIGSDLYTCNDSSNNKKSFDNINHSDFMEYILDINRELVDNLLIKYFEDVDPIIKHPEGI